jgi:hypothetical protein
MEEGGQPVRGAAVKIDGDVVFTDSQGSFLLRRKKPKESELSVAFDQFVLPGNYAVVSAPKMVKAEREESAELYDVVLKRMKNVTVAVTAEAIPERGSAIGTNMQNGTVLELPNLPLTHRFSMELISPPLAARMPVESRDANLAKGGAASTPGISVGSYYLYSAAGGAPVDLSPVKVRYAQPVGQRRTFRANSGKH